MGAISGSSCLRDLGECSGDLICVRADTGTCGTRDLADPCLEDAIICPPDTTCPLENVCDCSDCSDAETCPSLVVDFCTSNIIFSNCYTDYKIATLQDYNTNTNQQQFVTGLTKVITERDYFNVKVMGMNYVRNLCTDYDKAILRQDIGRRCPRDLIGYFEQS